MSKTLAAPPAWTIPYPTPEQQLAKLRAQYPDALAWYGKKSGLWLAAPSGTDELIQAHTAAGLSVLLEQHYKRMIPQTPRPAPARQTQHRTPSGDQTGAAVRSTYPAPVVSRTAAPSTPPRRGRLRAGMLRLGLVADAA